MKLPGDLSGRALVTRETLLWTLRFCTFRFFNSDTLLENFFITTLLQMQVSAQPETRNASTSPETQNKGKEIVNWKIKFVLDLTRLVSDLIQSHYEYMTSQANISEAGE